MNNSEIFGNSLEIWTLGRKKCGKLDFIILLAKKVRKVGLCHFYWRKNLGKLNFIIFRPKVQISKLFPNISELFIRNSELYSESPAVFTDRRQKRQPNHNKVGKSAEI
jgi:hypothetical protein